MCVLSDCTSTAPAVPGDDTPGTEATSDSAGTLQIGGVDVDAPVCVLSSCATTRSQTPAQPDVPSTGGEPAAPATPAAGASTTAEEQSGQPAPAGGEPAAPDTPGDDGAGTPSGAPSTGGGDGTPTPTARIVTVASRSLDPAGGDETLMRSGLPFTGLDLGPVALIGLLLVAGGVLLRRLALREG